MRRARRAGRTKGSRHLSLSATDAEWEVVRRNADARGLSIARYLVGLVERGGSEAEQGATVALSRDEQRELLGSVREIRALMLGQAVPEEAVPEEPAAPEPAPEEPGREEPEEDGEAERLRREIRDWPGRAQALIDDRRRTDAPLAVRLERRRLGVEALLAEGRAMEAEGSPHALHLAAMPGERAALAEAVSGLARTLIAVELLETEALHASTMAFARETGGIAFDAPDYGALAERLPSFRTPRGLSTERHRPIRALIARDARWRKDRKRVTAFLERAGAFLRGRGDLADDILALSRPDGSASPDRGPGRGWREEGNALLAEAKAIGEEIPDHELAAHLKAAGEEPGAAARLAAQLRARLGPGGRG